MINNFEKKAREFIHDSVWCETILLFGFMDENFQKVFLDACEVFKNPKVKDLNNIFDKWIKQFSKCSNSSTYSELYESEKYLSLIEIFSSNSLLIDNILEELKNEFGEQYLDIVTDLDAGNTSCDNSEAVNCYLFIKNLQNAQSELIEETKLKRNQIIDNFLNSHNIRIVNQNDEEVVLYKLDILRSMKIFPIEKLAQLQRILPGLSFSQFFGGKVDGLVKLCAVGANIPETWICCCENISNNQLPKISNYSVRSSFSLEDGKEKSFAGMFESYINIPENAVLGSIKKVFESAKAERVKAYSKDLHGFMTAIIQKTVTPKFAGVFFGDQSDLNNGVIEYVNGFGEMVVGGTSIPKREYAKNSVKMSGVFKKIIDIQKKFNVPCDIEWAESQDGELFFLQFRAITSENFYLFFEDVNNNLESGVVASKGFVSGKCVFMDEITDPFSPGGVLVTWYTDPNWTPLILQSKGVVVALGGFLSHAAIVCREAGIPCICSFGNENLEKLRNAKLVTIDTSKCLVEGTYDREKFKY